LAASQGIDDVSYAFDDAFAKKESRETGRHGGFYGRF
jgi:hypothetical protein